MLTLDTLKNFAESLPVSQFIRVHKSWIIAIPHIDFIERNRIMIGEHEFLLAQPIRMVFGNTSTSRPDFLLACWVGHSLLRVAIAAVDCHEASYLWNTRKVIVRAKLSMPWVAGF